MADEKLTYQLNGQVAVVTLDDGKANALSPDMLKALDAAFDRAEQEAGAVVLAGRRGRFSAGFDLASMTAGAAAARSLVTQGAELLLRMYMHPQPVVAACTGHALAAGALLTLAADTRVGTDGDYKIGLNEVAIGMRLPIFAVELARDRLSKRHFTAATMQARIYAPKAAVDAGFLDEVAALDDVVGRAEELAAELAELPRGAYALSKNLVRQRTVDYVRESLQSDMELIAPPSSAGKK